MAKDTINKINKNRLRKIFVTDDKNSNGQQTYEKLGKLNNTKGNAH